MDPDEALYDFTKGVARGTSLLEGTCAADTPVTVYEYMMRSIMECMDICLRAKGHADLVPLLPRYILFRLGLGMLQPRRIDDLWDRDSMYYNPYMEYLFPDRGAFYKLQRFADPDVDALIELCTEQWQNGWVLGDIVCGDESIVPHKGLFLSRQFIPRKPHTTGVKLYLLCDAQDGTFGMFICIVVRCLVTTPHLQPPMLAITPPWRLCSSGMMWHPATGCWWRTPTLVPMVQLGL